MSSLLTEQALRSAEGGVGPADERPLSEEERKMVTRLLADPFSFPQTFKTWLIAFLEGSDLTLPLGSVQGLVGLLGTQGGGGSGLFGLLPAGMLFPYAGETPPSGTLWANGAAVSRITYKRLFDAIGTKWGAGDGTNTFNLPDYQNRNIMGVGPGYAVGANEGRLSVNRGPSHHHHFTDTKGFSGGGSGSTEGAGDHTHQHINASSIQIQQGTQGSFVTVAGTGFGNTLSGGGHQHSFSVGVSGTVQVDGDTSGGGGRDQAAFAACYVVVNF